MVSAHHAVQVNPNHDAHGQAGDHPQRKSAEQDAVQLPTKLTGPANGLESGDERASRELAVAAPGFEVSENRH